ncbi:DNA-binding response regulator [Virgisporangium aliadipatigenens]|uniref:DNA-binding response regulator n=2 Tax=Virgisporangium aliadipatigenens TaxID=741659 RepID=A0A8J4DSW3_9ACTN|nr:DNA-binding response regulator [Virgisporangium aliadipatigenens]
MRAPGHPGRMIVVLADASIAMRGVAAALAGFPDLGPVAVRTDSGGLAPGDAAPAVVIANPQSYAVTRDLLEHHRVLAFCAGPDRPEPAALLAAGFRGYLTADSSVRELADAVRAVAAGHRHPLGPPSADRGVLTGREAEVLRSVSSGLTHKEVARRLGLSKLTVDTYVQRVRHKLGVGNKAELARAAIRYGLMD